MVTRELRTKGERVQCYLRRIYRKGSTAGSRGSKQTVSVPRSNEQSHIALWRINGCPFPLAIGDVHSWMTTMRPSLNPGALHWNDTVTLWKANSCGEPLWSFRMCKNWVVEEAQSTSLHHRCVQCVRYGTVLTTHYRNRLNVIRLFHDVIGKCGCTFE